MIIDKLERVDEHYQTAIPFKDVPVMMPNNREVAKRRLDSLKRRLRRDSVLREKYKHGIENLVKKGYAEPVEDCDHRSDLPVWFIPHHPVTNVDKPGKVRIVFDCAAKYQGMSLNDRVLQGPDLTNELLGELLRFKRRQRGLWGASSKPIQGRTVWCVPSKSRRSPQSWTGLCTSCVC